MNIKTTILALALGLLAVLPLTAQTDDFNFDDEVLAVSASGSSTSVVLDQAPGQVLCGPDGLMGKLCPHLEIGHVVVFRGSLPALDSDAEALGAFEAQSMRVKDLRGLSAGDERWSIDGCVSSAFVDGDTFLVLEHSQVVEDVRCGADGSTLGDLCPQLAPGDCGVFEGTFPAADADHPDQWVLRRLTADDTVTSSDGGGGGDCLDCDGR